MAFRSRHIASAKSKRTASLTMGSTAGTTANSTVDTTVGTHHSTHHSNTVLAPSPLSLACTVESALLRPSPRSTDHHCHAIDCTRHCAPERLMCPIHWRMVSLASQRAVWNTYRPGQCDDQRVSPAWLQAAKTAIGEVATKEGRNAQFVAWATKGSSPHGSTEWGPSGVAGRAQAPALGSTALD